MRSSSFWRLTLTTVALIALACRETRRVDAATLEQTADGPRLRVTIVGSSTDSRIAPIREALAHWNSEFARLGRTLRLDSAAVLDDSIPDETLRAASSEALLGAGPSINSVRARLSRVHGDIVIVLSKTDLISFGVPYTTNSQGVVVLRRADILPLSLPNTVRNVVAHELGHALGLRHNPDSTTLMCGRPANCRPAAFASDSMHFFPLTTADEDWIRRRWP